MNTSNTLSASNSRFSWLKKIFSTQNEENNENDIVKKNISSSLENKNWNNFYSAFEDRFRGSSEDISTRIKERYLDHIISTSKRFSTYEEIRALDLGCGKGEMLDLFSEVGFQVTGVDQAKFVTELKTNQTHNTQDLLIYLKNQPDESVMAVSMLHVIEHCHPQYMFEACQEIFRILKKNGILILETPSLFSLWSGTRQFYLDPTHMRPIHPDYLDFLIKYIGFSNCSSQFFAPVEHPDFKILDQNQIHDKNDSYEALKSWQQWLFGPQDFSLIATK